MQLEPGKRNRMRSSSEYSNRENDYQDDRRNPKKRVHMIPNIPYYQVQQPQLFVNPNFCHQNFQNPQQIPFQNPVQVPVNHPQLI